MPTTTIGEGLPAVAATLPAVLLLNGQHQEVRMHLAQAPCVPGRWDDIDIVHLRRDGFGLSLPRHLSAPFSGGSAPARLQLLPAVQLAGLQRGIPYKGVDVRAASSRPNPTWGDPIGNFNFMTWLRPQSIIAVLIAL